MPRTETQKEAQRQTKRARDKRYRELQPREKLNACRSRSIEARREYSQRLYAKRAAEGICRWCGKQPTRPTSILCQACHEQSVWKRRKAKFGIDEARFWRQLEAQDCRCAICTVLIGRDAHVDHDHRTKAVRGLLCGHCNRGIGHFRDSSEVVLKAAAYLKRYGL